MLKKLLFLLVGFPMILNAQIKGKVVAETTGEGLAFVTVVNTKTGRGTTSDIDGDFRIQAQTNDTLSFSYIGYKSQLVVAKEGMMVKLSESKVKLDEAVILPGENPAHRIIQRVIDNRKKNSPEGNFNFTYDSYNKLVFTMLMDSAKIYTNENLQEMDSTDLAFLDQMASMHLFMMESVTERKYLLPDRSSENIKASRVSGLENPDFALLASQLQSFNFYKPEVQLLGDNFYSPIAPNGIQKYVFTMLDTAYQAMDTIFIVGFQPRCGKNVKSLKGRLYIHTDGYALQNVLAEPNDDLEGFNIEIKQMYEKIEGYWFPKQLNSLIDVQNVESGVQGDAMKFVGIGRTYISNVIINPDLKRKDIGYLSVNMLDNAGQQPDSLWEAYRQEKFSKKDSTTYVVIDSISNEFNFDVKYKVLKSLVAGKVPVGSFNIDLTRLMAFNDYEGFRLGLGLETNDKISKKVQLGGYGAYGFKDRDWKYGGELTYWINKQAESKIRLEGSIDVVERGGYRELSKPALLEPSGFYRLFVNQMDQRAKARLSWGSKLPGWLQVELGASLNQWKSPDEYAWIQSFDEDIALRSTVTEEATIDARLRWSFKEKVMQTPSRRVVLSSPFPVFELAYEQSLSDVWGTLDYSRLQGSVSYKYRIASVGTMRAKVVGGKMFGDAPIWRQFNVRGVGGDSGISTRNAMETLAAQSVFTSDFVGVYFTHSFKDLLLSTEKFKPGINLRHNAIWSKAPKGNHEMIPMDDLESGYLEAGLELTNLLKLNTSAFGVGVFANYNDGNGVGLNEDVFFKINSSIAF